MLWKVGLGFEYDFDWISGVVVDVYVFVYGGSDEDVMCNVKVGEDGIMWCCF